MLLPSSASIILFLQLFMISLNALPPPPSPPLIATTLPYNKSTEAQEASIPAFPSLTPRATSPDNGYPGIYICPLPNWGGDCFWRITPPSSYTQCGSVTTVDGWSSLGPDKGIAVSVYYDLECTNSSVDKMVWPGTGDLEVGVGIDVDDNGSHFGVKVWPYTGGYRGEKE